MKREVEFRLWIKDAKVMTPHEGINYGHVLDYKESHDDIELLEYIGIKDINGKKIFEGDIVQKWHYNEKEWIAVVEHIDYIDSLMDDYKGKKVSGFYLTNKNWDYPNEELVDIEVIGNIYENPELLKTVQ